MKRCLRMRSRLNFIIELDFYSDSRACLQELRLDHTGNDNVAVDFVEFSLLRREQWVVRAVAELAAGNGCRLFQRLQNFSVENQRCRNVFQFTS